MKRILPAAALAILLHTGLLGISAEWIKGKTIHPPKSTAVLITMSFRQPEPISEIKKEPIKHLKVKPKEKIKSPEKPKPIRHVRVERMPEKAKESPNEKQEEKAVTAADSVESSVKEKPAEDNQASSGYNNMPVTRDAVPLYKNNPRPSYPRAARSRGFQGTVVLSVLVNENGRVENLWVFASSGYRVLDNAAIDAVKTWVFEPGIKGNRKTAMWVRIPVTFELKP